MREIATLAYEIEPDRQVAYNWLMTARIAEFGGKTAVELAFEGNGQRVVATLRALSGQTGLPP